MTREERSTDREEDGRAKRVPLGVPRDKLHCGKRAGYVRRWVNDREDRIQQAQAGGYSFVLHSNKSEHVGEGAESRNIDLGDRVSQVVGRQESGAALIAYLMEIKQELYDEDQAAKRAEIKITEDAIQRGENQSGLYVPQGGINITKG